MSSSTCAPNLVAADPLGVEHLDVMAGRAGGRRLLLDPLELPGRSGDVWTSQNGVRDACARDLATAAGSWLTALLRATDIGLT